MCVCVCVCERERERTTINITFWYTCVTDRFLGENMHTNLSFEESIMLIGFTQFLDKFCSFRVNKQSFQLLKISILAPDNGVWCHLPVQVEHVVLKSNKIKYNLNNLKKSVVLV